MLDQTLVNEIGKRKSFNKGKASARLTIFSDGVARLSSVLAREKGTGAGRAIMEQVCRYADENGLTLQLFVQRFGDPHEGMSNKELIEFYKKFGFYVEEDGRLPVMMWRDSQELQRL